MQVPHVHVLGQPRHSNNKLWARHHTQYRMFPKLARVHRWRQRMKTLCETHMLVLIDGPAGSSNTDEGTLVHIDGTTIAEPASALHGTSKRENWRRRWLRESATQNMEKYMGITESFFDTSNCCKRTGKRRRSCPRSV